MYEDLVKLLRSEVCVPYTTMKTMQDAADAIEELQQTVEHYKGCADDWYKEACDYKAMLPRWIPVTERLPEDEKDVLACYRFVHDGEMSERRFIGVLEYFAFDAAPHWQHESMGLTVTHWMPLPQPPKEET